MKVLSLILLVAGVPGCTPASKPGEEPSQSMRALTTPLEARDALLKTTHLQQLQANQREQLFDQILEQQQGN
jgi:hypothetical protein